MRFRLAAQNPASRWGMPPPAPRIAHLAGTDGYDGPATDEAVAVFVELIPRDLRSGRPKLP